MKILVTGGSGFIGSYLVNELTKNHDVVVFDNGFRAGFENIINESNLELIKGDVTSKEDWKKLPTDIDLAYHLAAINGTKYFYEMPSTVLEVNVRGTLNFVDWIKDTSIKRFFFASSSEVYGFPNVFPTPETEPLVVPDPKNPRFSYSSSKIIGETIAINSAKSSGIDFVIGRFHNVYGPKMGFEHVIPEFIRKCIKKEEFSVQGDGSDARCFCYISDAINAMQLLMIHQQSKNEIFNIGTNEEITINELILKLEKIYGKIDPVYKEFKNAGTKRRVPDISKIAQLGYIPKISFDEGLKNIYDWYSYYYNSH
jgi:nucleoside-diphosphate-sugar epimerase